MYQMRAAPIECGAAWCAIWFLPASRTRQRIPLPPPMKFNINSSMAVVQVLICILHRRGNIWVGAQPESKETTKKAPDWSEVVMCRQTEGGGGQPIEKVYQDLNTKQFPSFQVLCEPAIVPLARPPSGLGYTIVYVCLLINTFTFHRKLYIRAAALDEELCCRNKALAKVKCTRCRATSDRRRSCLLSKFYILDLIKSLLAMNL